MSDVMMAADDRPRHSAGYKSFKKKYRKMRIAFEHRMQESEDIVRQEARAKATVKRLAIENEYVREVKGRPYGDGGLTRLFPI